MDTSPAGPTNDDEPDQTLPTSPLPPTPPPAPAAPSAETPVSSDSEETERPKTPKNINSDKDPDSAKTDLNQIDTDEPLTRVKQVGEVRPFRTVPAGAEGVTYVNRVRDNPESTPEQVARAQVITNTLRTRQLDRQEEILRGEQALLLLDQRVLRAEREEHELERAALRNTDPARLEAINREALRLVGEQDDDADSWTQSELEEFAAIDSNESTSGESDPPSLESTPTPTPAGSPQAGSPAARSPAPPSPPPREPQEPSAPPEEPEVNNNESIFLRPQTPPPAPDAPPRHPNVSRATTSTISQPAPVSSPAIRPHPSAFRPWRPHEDAAPPFGHWYLVSSPQPAQQARNSQPVAQRLPQPGPTAAPRHSQINAAFTRQGRDQFPWSIHAPPAQFNVSRYCITREGVPAARARIFLCRVVSYVRLVRLCMQFGVVVRGPHTYSHVLIENLLPRVPNANVILNSPHLGFAVFTEAFPHWEIRSTDEPINLLLQLWARNLDLFWSTRLED